MPPALDEILAALVRCNSVNPAFGAGDTAEAAAAGLVAGWLHDLGAEVTTLEFAPGRRSVVGRFAGRGVAPSLMFYGHLDTVGVEGMTSPFEPKVRDGRMYGRGTYDMKGGVAACLAAARDLAGGGTPPGDLLVAAVADEETESRGMRQVLDAFRPDMAIVTEATELEVGVAHKGFCWIEIETRGRAAHGSRPDEGIDANAMIGPVLVALAEAAARLQDGPRHPLLGPGSMHVGQLSGGTGPSIYAAACRLTLERRTLPGESAATVLAEVEAILDRVRQAHPGTDVTSRLVLERPSFEQDPDAPLVRAVRDAAGRARGVAPAVIGHSFWMDASLLKAAGTDTVVIGPAGAGAHAALEWVDLASVEALARILADAAREAWAAGPPGMTT